MANYGIGWRELQKKEVKKEDKNVARSKCVGAQILFIIILVGLGKTGIGLFILGFLSYNFLGTIVGLGLGTFLIIFSLRKLKKISLGGDRNALTRI